MHKEGNIMPYFVTSDNCKLYYENKGNGDPIIFVHGWTASRLSFLLQTQYLSKNHEVITYDLRGHGASDRGAVTESNMTIDRLAIDLRELIEYLGFEKVNVCGWSMGASTIFNYVQLYGNDRLKSIGIIDMTPKLVTDDEWTLGLYGKFNSKDNNEFIISLAKSFSETMADFVPLTFAKWKRNDPEIFPELFKMTMDRVSGNTPHCMLPLWISMSGKDYRQILSKIEVPTFLAYSGDGQLYSPAHGEYMKEHIKNSVLNIFPRCGHGLIVDNPEKFNRDYDAFLRTL